MFNNAPATNTNTGTNGASNGNRKEAIGFLNYGVTLANGETRKLGSIALEKGNAVHEAIFKAIMEDEANYHKLNLTVKMNPVRAEENADDIKLF